MMKNIPKTIYLNIGAGGIAEDFNELEDITWSEDRISADDIPYQLNQIWYDLKKNPSDLPTASQNVIVINQLETIMAVYDGKSFITNVGSMSFPIAWMEIPKFEIK